MKTFGVCNSTTGYAYNILTHFVSETSYNEDIIDATMSEKVFEYLLSPLGTGHHVFADRYYTTYKLLEYMTQKKFYYTGTFQTNREEFPVEVKTSGKMKFQEVKSFKSKNGYLCITWKDKKAKKSLLLGYHQSSQTLQQM